MEGLRQSQSSIPRRLDALYLAIVGCLMGCVSGDWHPKPDAALYMSLANSIREERGYTLWGKPEVHVPPGFPWVLSWLPELEGDSGQLLAANALQSLLTLGALTLVWQTLPILGNPRTDESADVAPVCAMIVFAFTHITWLLSVQILSEPLFASLLWLGIGSLNRQGKGPLVQLLGALALVASCWVRLPGLAVCWAAAIGLLISRPQGGTRGKWLSALLLASGSTATALFFLGWHESATHGPLNTHLESYVPTIRTTLDSPSYLLVRRLIENILETSVEWMRVLVGQEAPSAICLLLWTPCVWGMWHSIRRKRFFGPLVALSGVLPWLAFSPLQERHLWPFAPLLLLYWFQGLQAWLIHWRPCKAHRLLIGIACILALCHLPKDVRLMLSQRIPSLRREVDYPRELEAAAAWLASHNEAVPFLAPAHHRELAFLAGQPTSPNGSPAIASEADLKNWYGVEYRSLVIFHSTLQPQFARIEEIAANYPYHRVVYETQRVRIYQRTD